MCVIISSPSSKARPTLNTLRLCAASNRDGSGVAWVQHNKVQFVKGLSYESIHDLLGVIEGPVVIHFRIATAGGRRPELCHPFPISPTAPLKQYGQAGAVLFHNGHWHDWEKYSKHFPSLTGPLSDSRVIAAGCFENGRKFLKLVQKANAGRFALFTSKGAELFGEWHEKGGCKFSNLNWVPRSQIEKSDCPCPSKPSRKQDELNFRNPGLVREAMACFGD